MDHFPRIAREQGAIHGHATIAINVNIRNAPQGQFKTQAVGQNIMVAPQDVHDARAHGSESQ